MDCIFCKLANGEIPTATLYEDDEFRVILDQGPATEGHALILPKQHFANIYEIPDETNLVQNNGEAAGQTVFHFHMHLIPRYEGDNAGIAAWKQGTLEDAVKEQIIESVTAELKA